MKDGWFERRERDGQTVLVAEEREVLLENRNPRGGNEFVKINSKGKLLVFKLTGEMI